MSMTRHHAVSLALLAGALIVACSDASKDTPQVSQPAANKPPVKAAANLSPDMVSAVSSGNTSSSVSVHFAIGAPPIVNKALSVNIAIVPHRKFAALSAHFESRDGLAVTSGQDFPVKSDVDSEKALDHQLVLLPSREGVLMVTASVETESDDGNVTRIYSIPIIVAAGTDGSVSEKPAAN